MHKWLICRNKTFFCQKIVNNLFSLTYTIGMSYDILELLEKIMSYFKKIKIIFLFKNVTNVCKLQNEILIWKVIWEINNKTHFSRKARNKHLCRFMRVKTRY
jgi:hypothetical protein